MIRTLREAAAEAGPLRATLLVVILVHSAGNFFYATLWRTVVASDFDVNDFKAYYTGALALAEGRPDLLYPDPSTLNLGLLPDQPWVRFAVERGIPHPSGYIYPPFLAVAIRPLTSLSYHRANQTWFVLNTLLFAGSVIFLATWRPARPSLPVISAVVFTALNFYPTFRAFQCGQVGLLMLFLLSGALWCLERSHDRIAGGLVAAAAAVKITPGILILWFLVARRYRAAAWSVAVLAALYAVSLAGAGWANHVTFVTGFLPVLSRGAATFANQSLSGFLSRIGLDVTMNAFEFVQEPAWLSVTGRLAGAVLLIGSLFLARKISDPGGGAAAGYGLVLLASLLASPISWEHHFVIALIPIAILIEEAHTSGPLPFLRTASLVAGYVLLATNAYDLIRRHFPYALGRVAISYTFYGAAIVWALMASRALAPRAAVTAAAAGAPRMGAAATRLRGDA